MKTLEYFDLYTKKYQWKIIPVYAHTKIPVGRNWNDRYNMSFARKYIASHDPVNLGLLLGDIVDVEGDTVESNQFLNDILKDYPHPSYVSNKSVHHLFINPDEDLTGLKVNGLEFRGHRHHSVIPPSSHKAGNTYEWLTPPGQVPLMPQRLLQFYNAHAKKKRQHRTVLRENFIAPLCTMCKESEFIHKKRYLLEVEAFKQIDKQWLCHPCRRLYAIDVRNACRTIRKTSTH